MRRLVWILVLLLGAVSPIWAGSWYCGMTHVHSDNSDGTRTMGKLAREAIRNGYQFIVISDHVEKIEEKCGFETYLTQCANCSGITVIPGVEVAVGKSHTVVFGNLTVDAMQDLSEAESVASVIGIASQYGLFSVAAHPFDLLFPYDCGDADGVRGQEFFNDGAINYKKDLAWWQTLQKSGDVFCWAGNDSHSAADPSDNERWTRSTWVYAESGSKEDILAAFAAGHTYASSRKGELANLNLVPGFAYQSAEPRFQFTVKVKSDAFRDPYTVNIYRDSKVIFTGLMPSGNSTKAFDYQDKDCLAGKYKYRLEVSGLLITSPICLEVANAIRSSESSLVPDLLGKTRQEIESSISAAYLQTDYGRNDKLGYERTINNFAYSHYPHNYYDVRLSFIPCSRECNPSEPQPNVCLYSIKFFEQDKNLWMMNKHPYLASTHLSPAKLVPQHVLKTKPWGVFRSVNQDNGVVVIWYIRNKTYLLVFYDAPNRPLFTTKKVKGGERFYQSKASTDFSKGGVEYFAAIDGIVKVTSKYDYNGCNFYLCFEGDGGSVFLPFDK